MQISKELPQFSKRSIIVAAGSRSAKVFRAHSGEIELVDQLKIETLASYSDKESFFVRSGKGRTYGFGAVLEEKKKEFLAKFARELGDRIEKAFQEWSAESIYLFVPKHMKDLVPKRFSSEVKKSVVLLIEGNFVDKHPFDLLKIIMEKVDKKKPLTISEKVKNLLTKKR
ncbi:MAG: host attachment protein [Minisyncoccales bacterium]